MSRLDTWIGKRSNAELALWIMGIALLFTLPLCGGFEYFRHTEADRTLISWEMLQRGDFLIPHLLGDLYITKPPLFYDIMAFSFWLAGGPYEWAARLPSVLLSALLLAVFFLFLRRSGLPKTSALFAVIVLGSSWPWFQSSVIAEMDQTYSFFCSISLFLACLSFDRRYSLLTATGCWLFAGLAFLAKGPPILVFLGSGLAFYSLYELNRTRSFRTFAAHVLRHSFGFLLFAAIVAAWIGMLQTHVPAEDLQFHFEQEILRRFVADPHAADRARGFWFYPGGLLLGFVPWSLALPGLIWLVYSKRVPFPALSVLPAPDARLKAFGLSVLLPSLLIFSLSSGKSTRYLLPLYPWVALLITQLADIFMRSAYGKHHWQSERSPTKLVMWLTVVLLLARIPYQTVFAAARNDIFRAPEVAREVKAALPADQPLYILEMFERWIPYYLLREGRETLRLTPALAADFSKAPAGQKIYILLSRESEAYRFPEISSIDPTSRLAGDFHCGHRTLTLLEMEANLSGKLKLERIFPTDLLEHRHR